MISTSRMSGTLVRVVVPSASRAAAISFRTLFLAPGTRHLAGKAAAAADHEPVHAPIVGPDGACHPGRRGVARAT